MSKKTFVPVTPGGSILMHLESNTKEEAWKKLMHDARHMPYDGKRAFERRGYTVEELSDDFDSK